MPRGPSSSSSEIRDIVGQFVDQLSVLIEQDAVSRAREAILSAFSGGGGAAVLSSVGRRRGRPPGRPPGALAAATHIALVAKGGRLPARKRRKAPIQLCPVPGCTNRAAPVFGMVCGKHKDLPKSEIKRYREARRAERDQPKGAKVKASSKAGRKPGKTKTQKKKTTTKTKTKKMRKSRSRAKGPAKKRAAKPVSPPVVAKPPVPKPVPPQE